MLVGPARDAGPENLPGHPRETERPVGGLSDRLLAPTAMRRRPGRWHGLAERIRLPHWLGRALLLYLVSRLLVALGALMALGIAPPPHPQEWLERWDSFWYLEVARNGYPDTIGPLAPQRPFSPLAFFPLWPMLVRGTGVLLGGHPVLAAYLLNFVLGAVLTLLVRKLFAMVSDDRTADVGVLLFVFFPGTNVFSAAYSEPLALCLAAGTLIALLQQRWVLAGSLAALAGATRPPVALAVFVALAWAVLVALRHRRARALVALALAPLGLLAFAVYGWRHTGHLLAWHEAEKMFGNKIDFGRSFLVDVTRAIQGDVRAPATGLAVLVYLSIAVLAVLLVFFIRRPPPALLTLYTVAALAVPATTSALMPKVRFLAAAFPLMLPLAAWLRQRGRETVLGLVVGIECALLVGFTMMHLLSRLAFP